MIHYTKNVQYWSFWCQWWSDHQDQGVFWGNRVVKTFEASEVSEAAEVNEVAEVTKACKITTEVFKGIQVLEFNNLRTKITLFRSFEKQFFWQNHENSCWILAPFLSEAVEASLCYFFENWLMKLKCPNLRNTQIPSFWCFEKLFFW